MSSLAGAAASRSANDCHRRSVGRRDETHPTEGDPWGVGYLDIGIVPHARSVSEGEMAGPNDANRAEASRLREEAAALLRAAAREPLRAELYRKRAAQVDAMAERIERRLGND